MQGEGREPVMCMKRKRRNRPQLKRLRSFGQQLPDTEMSKHHVRRAIQGFIVRPLKAIAFDRRMKQTIDFPDEVFDIFIGHVAAVIFQQVIDANEEIGERVEPRKPGVLLKQVE